jgi:hypothetical protein
MVLKPTERDELLIELKTVMVGIEGTDDRGMAGDLKEIKRTLIKQNGRIRKNTLAIISLTSFLVGLGVLEWQDVINIFGG